MRIYLINLARRPDRLAAMQARAAALGLALTRIDAVDAKDQDPDTLARFDADGPLGEIPRGDKGCTLSHARVWADFLASGESHAAILEDDVVLGPGAAMLLKDAAWIPPDANLVKLEHYGPPGQRVLVSNVAQIAPGFCIGRMRSRHTGAAAYILSREAARILSGIDRYTLPVDHLLFNPNNSPLFAALAPRQLMPAIARQEDFVGGKSDIEGWRVGMRKFGWTYARREIIRFGYDLKLLPLQAGLLLSGRARFAAIGMEP